MRDLVMVVSDLYLPDSGAASFAANDGSVPGLSRAARFGKKSSLDDGWRPWVARWLGRADLADVATASIAAVTADGAAPSSGSTVWCASPVHLMAGLTSVHLHPRGLLRLDQQSRAALIRSFEDTFAGSGWRLIGLPSGEFLFEGQAVAAVVSVEPARCLGSSVGGSLPQGSGAQAIQRVLAEIEMWLHEHPVNVQRQQQRKRTVSTLWPWGNGPAIDAEERRLQVREATPAVFADDAYIDGLLRLSGHAMTPLPSTFDKILDTGAARTMIVLEAFQLHDVAETSTPLQALEILDKQWIEPAMDALSKRRIDSISILANDRCLVMRPGDRLKLWRRRRHALSGLL